MLTKRIISCLDIKEGRVVKGVHFINLKDAGDPLKNAKFYEKEGADELVFLDITASHEKRSTTIDLVKEIARVVFMPFTVGGGIKNVSDIRKLLLAGAEKVSLNTSAVKNPQLISEAGKIFGKQCIVVAIDAKLRRDTTEGSPEYPRGARYDRRKSRVSPRGAIRPKEVPSIPEGRDTKKWEVYINGGRIPTGIDAVKWAKKVEKMGAGEILLTSMDCDGTKSGFDIELTRIISTAVKIPVIASGGAGKSSHFFDVFEKTKATAALAASIFHYRKIRIKEIKQHLNKKGVKVRI